MSNKVYLLICGTPNEPRVRGVFSTRQAAEAALRFGDDASTVEEFEVDAPLPVGPEGHSLWHVQWEKRFADLSAFRVEAFETEPIGEVEFDGNFYVVTVWAVDEEQALEIGGALISQFKALKNLLR